MWTDLGLKTLRRLRVRSRKGAKLCVYCCFVEQSKHSQYLSGSLAFMHVLNWRRSCNFKSFSVSVFCVIKGVGRQLP